MRLAASTFPDTGMGMVGWETLGLPKIRMLGGASMI
jgi:hypothetical protein